MYYVPYRCRARTNKNKICKLKPQSGSFMCFIHRNVLLIEEYDGADYDMPICKNSLTSEDIDDEIRIMIKNGLLDENELEDIPVRCSCCFDNYEKSFTVVCTESKRNDYEDRHIACYMCMKSYIENIINEKQQIKCITRNCNSNYDDNDILPALDDLYDSYKNYKLIDDVARLASLLDNYHICPFCSKYGIIVDNVPYDNENNIKYVKCANEECQKKWCITCRKYYHGDDSCNRIRTIDKDDIRKIIDEVIDSALIHTCPKCYTKYDKIDGCNMMLCKSCETYSCYVCGILITPVNGLIYGHFAQGSPCTIYNTDTVTGDASITEANIKFNNNRVEKELKKLIDINKSDNDVVDAILNDLVERGYQLSTFVTEKKYIVSTKSKKTIKKPQKSFQMRLRGHLYTNNDSDNSDSDDIDIRDIDSDSDSDNNIIIKRRNLSTRQLRYEPKIVVPRRSKRLAEIYK
jgi:hypothetical protein